MRLDRFRDLHERKDPRCGENPESSLFELEATLSVSEAESVGAERTKGALDCRSLSEVLEGVLRAADEQLVVPAVAARAPRRAWPIW